VIVATFVNPTTRRVMLPTEFVDDDGQTGIAYFLQSFWNGKNGDSVSGSRYVGVSRCPPTCEYLEPGKQKSYRLKWKSDVHGKGVMTLTYKFLWNGKSLSGTLTLQTH